MNHETMSTEEMNLLRQLQAKQKRIQRANKSDIRFLNEADKRKDELLVRWGLSSVSDMSSSNTDDDLSDTLGLSYDLEIT
jgi:hypothetical protein